MLHISVLTENKSPNARAFNATISAVSPILKRKGLHLRFHSKISDPIFQADILFVNSSFFRPVWRENKHRIFDFLQKCKRYRQKILWFDTTDSTWSTQLEVLPYVDSYLKNQIYNDKSLYLKTFRTGRIFTDYFDELYSSGEHEFPTMPASRENLDKIIVSWSPFYQLYDEKRYSLASKLKNTLRPFYWNLKPQILLSPSSYSPSSPRQYDISARFGLSHTRPSVVAHRKAVATRLHARGVDTRRIPLKDYFNEMRNAKISVSPFGVGEFCYRDYESIICGAALLKPDMSHLRTWPELYRNEDTFLSHKWDLSDFDDKVDLLLADDDKRIGIAENAQKKYLFHFSEAGMDMLAHRIISFTSC
jgi:hypothetical protein